MSFVSYAQNLEDVVLYRALKHVENGFYVDVGAQDPVVHSVTKAFYDRGWHGINVEPNAEFFQALQQSRVRDTNLNVAAGAYEGEVVFHEVVHTGGSTTIHAYAELYAESGYEVKSYEVPCTTLDSIWAENGVSIVHFLKIDVEGAENNVLKGFSFGTVRPWILVVETSVPFSNEAVSPEWESMVLAKKCEAVYRDGLNSFYVSEEHSELRARFAVPPNVYDDYVSWELAERRERSERLSLDLRDLRSSYSWRLTAPARMVCRVLGVALHRIVRRRRERP